MRRQTFTAITIICIALCHLPAAGQNPPTLDPPPTTRGRLTPRLPGSLQLRLPQRSITAAETSVAAFVGATSAGPVDSATLVTSFADYAAQFGGLDAASAVSHAVRLFFENGGTRAWVVRTDLAALPGDADAGTGVYALNGATPLNLLCIPEIADQAVITAAESFCARRRAFLLIDPPASASTAAAVQGWLTGADSPPRTRDCAAYWPWLRVPVTPGAAETRDCGPSGAVAGVIARTDATRGVWKAPAGMEADLRGVTAPLHAITSQETAALNPVGVNALRELPGGGLVVWGARTRSSDPEWRYVPVRRMALMIEESMHAGTQWVVTEPNEEALWAQVRSATEAFMLDLWRRGALQGTRPDDAFFVRCGLGSTMTTADIAAGRLNIIVGFAPLRPAEFVVLRITKQLPVP